MNKINKLILPATILMASIILGGFYYASQVNKQRSIEQQQSIKIIQEQEATYRKECQNEREGDYKLFDGTSPELAKLGLKNKGYVDKNGFFIDDDIWLKKCVEKKLDIWNK